MLVDSIQLVNFRNYQKQNLRFKNGINVFVGENGQGKTNLLEAIYSLTKGASFRPGKSETFINNFSDTKQSVVQGILENQNLKNLVRLEFLENKRHILLNQKRTNSSVLLRQFPSILFSPESLASIKSGPEERRNLLDDWLTTHSVVNLKKLQDFSKVLKNRNHLLKSIKEGIHQSSENYRLLSAVNELFLEKSVDLVEARLVAIDSIEPLLQESMKELNQPNSENVDISVDYLVSGKSARHQGKQWLYNALNTRLKELFQREIELGYSLSGPQKHDIQFLYNTQDSRYFCSQGQQRALILSFKMAQIMYHYRVYQSHPILLLDDVLSELDLQKRLNLIEFLKKIQTQIFITTTDFGLSEEFGEAISIFNIKNGGVTNYSDQRI